MNPQSPKFLKLAFLGLVLFLTVSCSKDTDLLADYAVSDSIDSQFLGNLVADDQYFMANNESMVLDILSNDTFEKPDKVKIVQVSNPNNGTVVINEDKTVTYSPESQTTEETETIEQTNTTEAVDSQQESNGSEQPSIQADPKSQQQPTPTQQPDEIQQPEAVDEPKSETNNTPETSVPEQNKDTNTDTFTYITETTNEDGSTERQEGTVSIVRELGKLKAFPGAEGFGKNTTGGRGGRIVEVTNLNDDGQGSLRAALKMKGARTIIFKVGGTIECKSYLSIPHDSGNVTVAGQTAPGGGIQVKNAELRIQASNVIVRYLKLRLGHVPIDRNTGNEDGIRIIAYANRHTKNVIIDHCSVAWSIDENIEIGGIGGTSKVSDVTIQNCIVAENIIDSKYGMILWRRATNISVYRNLFAHQSERNLAATTCGSTFEFVNNLIYGYKAATSPTYENQFDVIGNVYKPSPLVKTRFQNVRLEASTNNCPDGNVSRTRSYIFDNKVIGREMTMSSNLEPYLESSPVMSSGISSILRSSEVESSILEGVGASLQRDNADLRVINDVINETGKYDNNDANARIFPSIANGVAYEDSDKDGIDDNWEIQNGLNPDDSNDGNYNDNDEGYTNLEVYLHLLTVNDEALN